MISSTNDCNSFQFLHSNFLFSIIQRNYFENFSFKRFSFLSLFSVGIIRSKFFLTIWENKVVCVVPYFLISQSGSKRKHKIDIKYEARMRNYDYRTSGIM